MDDELEPADFGILMSRTSLCVLIHDAASKDILWANPAACEMLEFSLDEIKPLKAPDMSSQAREYSRAIGRAWLQRAVDEGSSRILWRYRAKSGREFPTEALAVLVQLGRGPAVMVQFRDIEKEQAIERSLHRTEEYFQALARHTSAGAVVLDRQGVVEYASGTALSQFKVGGRQLIGARITDLAEITSASGQVGWAAAVNAALPVVAVRLEVRTADVAIWLGGSLDHLHVDGDDLYLLTLHDITDRVVKDLEHGRRVEYENYLSRYNAMGDMAMAIAHELGQPLAAAGNFLAGARLRTTPEGSYALDSARRQIDRASAIVKALREFVGHLEHVETLVDLNDVVRECLYFVRLRADGAGVRVRESWSEEPIPVRCERVLTGQVVLNLCFNALDEMAGSPEPEREITVATAREAGIGRFTVEDRGKGLGGLAADIFDQPFTSKEHGSGIGLALSHRIISRQHGRLVAWSREPRGAAFSFTLPLADDEPGAPG
jgi:two-component system, LuxR family, sensor kinase FixL